MAQRTRSQRTAKKPMPTAEASNSSPTNPMQSSSTTPITDSSSPSFFLTVPTSQSTAASQPSSSQSTFTSSFEQLLAQIQHDITQDSLWMGNPAFRDHVEWARVDESNDVVVEKQNPNVVADLTCIAEMSSVKYWMFPGGYCTAARVDGDEGSNGFKPVPFHRSRGSARLVQPRKPRLDKWWTDTTKNLAALRREGTKKPTKTDIFDDNYSQMVRIRHDWFKPKDTPDFDDINSEDESQQLLINDNRSHTTTPSPRPDKGKAKENTPHNDQESTPTKVAENVPESIDDEYKDPFDDPQYHLSTWTFFSQSDWATTKVNNILDDDELQSVPLPAFDLKRDRPIHPNDCETMLKGALLKVTFNLARQTIGQKEVNIYLDVVKITRLLPPGYEDKPTSTAVKRRAQGRQQGPSKKPRLPRY